MQSKSICTRTGFHVAHAAWFCRHSVTFSATRVPFGHPTHACTLTPHTCTAHTRTDTHAPCRVHTQAHLDAHAHTPGLKHGISAVSPAAATSPLTEWATLPGGPQSGPCRPGRGPGTDRVGCQREETSIELLVTRKQGTEAESPGHQCAVKFGRARPSPRGPHARTLGQPLWRSGRPRSRAAPVVDRRGLRHVFLTLMPSLPLLLRQELEFEDVTAVLHCVHSFLAAKVASVDPAFMGSQSSARKYTCSS